MLTNSLKILDTTKTEFFELLFFPNDQNYTGLFRHFSNPAFCGQKKMEKIFFDFEIIAFELVPLDTRFYWERIFVIGCEYVNKQFRDFRYY